jgi:hypothetical protein
VRKAAWRERKEREKELWVKGENTHSYISKDGILFDMDRIGK